MAVRSPISLEVRIKFRLNERLMVDRISVQDDECSKPLMTSKINKMWKDFVKIFMNKSSALSPTRLESVIESI